MIDLLEISKETSLYDHGFYKIKNKEDLNLTEIINNAKRIETSAEDQKSGYSTDIYEYLDNETKLKLNQLALKFLQYEIVKKYLIFPSLLKIRVLKSKFNDVAFKNPSHAMLWHRDLDDVFSQLKFIIPLNSTNKENGAFSVSSKKIASRDKILIDKKLLMELKNSKDEYRKEDEVRVSNEMFQKKFSSSIYEFVGDFSDILIVDTNKCYHKGGQVLSEGLERYMLHFHIGSPTNSFHPRMNSKSKNLINLIHLFSARFVRMLVKIYFFIINKKINSKKIILE